MEIFYDTNHKKNFQVKNNHYWEKRTSSKKYHYWRIIFRLLVLCVI